jgi:hypothetical protein
MRGLKVGQGAIAGVVTSLVLAAAIAGPSSDPLPTFGYVLAVALSMAALTIVGLVAVNRRAQPPKGR